MFYQFYHSSVLQASSVVELICIYKRDAIIDGVKEQVTKHATEAITSALPGMLDSAMPELPEVTGPAIPTLP